MSSQQLGPPSPFAPEITVEADWSLTTLGSAAPASTSDRGIAHGILRNFNTIEDFKNADKAALMDELADKVSLHLGPLTRVSHRWDSAHADCHS